MLDRRATLIQLTRIYKDRVLHAGHLLHRATNVRACVELCGLSSLAWTVRSMSRVSGHCFARLLESLEVVGVEFLIIAQG